ncbi:MAG: ethanolamine utilization protein EutQ [Pseudomonadota bacterium]
MTISDTKAPARVARFADLEFVPRFAYGEMAQLAPVAGAEQGTELGAGLVRMTGARIPWQVRYDEVLIVLEGRLAVQIGDQRLEAGPKDSLWLPAGTELVYEADEALVAYAIHPVNWAEREAAGDSEQ